MALAPESLENGGRGEYKSVFLDFFIFAFEIIWPSDIPEVATLQWMRRLCHKFLHPNEAQQHPAVKHNSFPKPISSQTTPRFRHRFFSQQAKFEIFTNLHAEFISSKIKSTTATKFKPGNKQKPQPLLGMFSFSQPISGLHLCAHGIEPIRAGKRVSQIFASVFSSDTYQSNNGAIKFCY